MIKNLKYNLLNECISFNESILANEILNEVKVKLNVSLD